MREIHNGGGELNQFTPTNGADGGWKEITDELSRDVVADEEWGDENEDEEIVSGKLNRNESGRSQSKSK